MMNKGSRRKSLRIGASVVFWGLGMEGPVNTESPIRWVHGNSGTGRRIQTTAWGDHYK